MWINKLNMPIIGKLDAKLSSGGVSSAINNMESVHFHAIGA